MITFKKYRKLLKEGGAAGHMLHLFDDLEMSFGDLKKVIKQSLTGELEVVEKTDGQQLMVTWKDNQIKGARNKTTILNPLSISEMSTKFEGRGELQKAFVNTMNDLQSAISQITSPENFFGDGNKYLSIEIIYPPTKNVIDYGNKAILQFHDITTFDEKAKKIDVDPSSAQKLFKKLSKNDALKQKTFEIIGSQKIKTKDLSKKAPVYIKKLKKIQGSLSDKTTLGEYYDLRWAEIIKSKLPSIDNTNLKILVLRYSRYMKSVSKVKLKKIPDVYELVNVLDKQQADIYKEIKKPLELLIMELGGEVLLYANGFITVNPLDTISALKTELDDIIKRVDKGEISPDLKNKIEYHLDYLNKIGLDKIAPSEGVVFKYKDKTFKMTGLFGKINQILGLFKYG
jgi:hypothetical protein